jgi:hypothetical protein
MDNQPEFSLQSLRITFSDAIRYLNAKTEPKCPACSETVFEILTDENNHVGIGGIEFNQSPHMRMNQETLLYTGKKVELGRHLVPKVGRRLRMAAADPIIQIWNLSVASANWKMP